MDREPTDRSTVGDDRDLLDELTRLRDRLERAEARLAAIESPEGNPRTGAAPVPTTPDRPCTRSHPDPSPITDNRTVTDRRGMLAKAGTVAGIAVAGLAGAVATASPAAAANGDPLTMGSNNSASAQTRSYNAFTSQDHLFEFCDTAIPAPEGSGLATLVGSAQYYPIGVLGYSSVDSGTAVYGRSTGNAAYAVQAIASGSGSAGVYASGNIGAWSHGVSQAVHAEAGSGGTAVYTTGGTRGLLVNGATYPLAIPPNGAGTTAPASAANTGDVYVDSVGTLYHCVAGGTPGTWRRLSGPATAGAYTAVTPTRVYDSRLTDGTITGGATRTLSVANGIDITTGSVTVPNLVPAGATAIQYNLTVTNTVGNGYLQIAPGTATTITSSSINWSTTGQILANGLSVKLDTNRQVKAFAGGGSTHFVIDVLGYYH